MTCGPSCVNLISLPGYYNGQDIVYLIIARNRISPGFHALKSVWAIPPYLTQYM